MMAYPKMKPCPECNDTTNLNVFTYDNGCRHVECVKCNYLGPGCTSIHWAIRHRNSDQDTCAVRATTEGSDNG
jgi:Zn ribbon nucleic-acid-binding protein